MTSPPFNPDEPREVTKPWMNFVRRVRSAAAKHNPGVLILQVTVIVDASGNPVGWSSPRCTPIEPSSKSEEILKLLTP